MKIFPFLKKIAFHHVYYYINIKQNFQMCSILSNMRENSTQFLLFFIVCETRSRIIIDSIMGRRRGVGVTKNKAMLGETRWNGYKSRNAEYCFASFFDRREALYSVVIHRYIVCRSRGMCSLCAKSIRAILCQSYIRDTL